MSWSHGCDQPLLLNHSMILINIAGSLSFVKAPIFAEIYVIFAAAYCTPQYFLRRNFQNSCLTNPTPCDIVILVSCVCHAGLFRECAGTGRQARLRGVCQPTWEFKSPLSHQKSTSTKWCLSIFTYYFLTIHSSLKLWIDFWKLISNSEEGKSMVSLQDD